MKKIIILLIAIPVLALHPMSVENPAVVSDNPTLVRLASLVKNRIYELKSELNSLDQTGNLQLMHLEIFESHKDQTKAGLFLECIKNVPCAIHSPLGRWQFAKPYQDTGKHAEKLMESLIKEFDLTFEQKYIPFHRSYSNGTRIASDPVCIWRIGKVGQNPLDKAAYKGQTEYMDAVHAKAVWKALFTQ